MKKALFILLVFVGAKCFGQTFTDIASQEGITFTQSSALNFGNGMSFYDFNEDGWDDLTFPSNVDSIYFYSNTNGSYSKLSPSLYAPGEVRQVSWVDYENDGDLDLFISFNDIGIRLYENDGNFQFTDVTAAAGFDMFAFQAYGFSFADPDMDGDLDVYVCVYSISITPYPTPNYYYQNQGDGTFIEKGAAYNLDNGLKPSFQGVWFDANNDQLLDLHVINDRHGFQDELYLNNGLNNYAPSASALGIDNLGHWPMSVSISDFNNDGYQDVFKSNSANGSQYNGEPLDYKLFQNDGGTSFINIATAMNINHQAFAWGGLWVDYNNDSFEDLYVATGFVDYINNPVLSSVFFTNNQGVSFSNSTDSIQANITKTSYCPVKGDINRDGFYDIVVLNNNAPPSILLNGGNSNNSVRITAIGAESNRMAIGSTIKVYANNTCQTQTIFCGSGLCAQDSQHKLFGIGNATEVDSVIVIFPNGNVTKRFNLLANTEHEIPEITFVDVALNTGQSTNDFCTGDSIQIGWQGLTNYVWNTGQTSAFIYTDTTGIYSFTAENLSGDTIFQSADLYLTFHDGLPHQTITSDAPCGDNSFGYAEIIPINMTEIDNVLWSNGVYGSVNDNLAPGYYTYQITSIHGCQDSGEVTIDYQQPFNTQYFTTPFTDVSGGSVQFYTWGGAPPITYSYNSNFVSDYIDDLIPGTYEVVVSDANGCIDTINFDILDNSSLKIIEQNSSEIIMNYNSGKLSVCGLTHSSNSNVQIINSLGQPVTEWKSKKGSDCEKKSLNLSQGWYIAVLRDQQNLITYKFFVE